MTDIRWVALVGIPPLPRQVCADFKAVDKAAAYDRLAQLRAYGAVPDDALVMSRLEYDELERGRLARLAKLKQQPHRGYR